METFVVRVWRPQTAETSGGLHGTVVHLSSGDSLTFTGPQMLVRFLTAAGADGDVTLAAPDGPATAAT